MSTMNIEIITRHVELSQDDRDLALLRCERIVQRYDASVQSITLRLEDINGPRGGIDKRCSIIARLSDGTLINSNRTAAACGVAIGKALDVLRSKLRKRYGSRKGGAIMAA